MTTRHPCLMRALVKISSTEDTHLVFFEAPWETFPELDVEFQVRVLVAGVAWVEVDQVAVVEIKRERQVLDNSCGLPATGDMRLFEVGAWHGPIYAEPERTWLLVTPATLRRLAVAQRALPIIDADASMPMPL